MIHVHLSLIVIMCLHIDLVSLFPSKLPFWSGIILKLKIIVEKIQV